MTIDEALEVLEAIHVHNRGCWSQQELDATKLGIEALKQHKLLKGEHYFNLKYLLPGETEQ